MERGTEEVEEGMGLKWIIRALLPSEVQEHILGDLEERGFRSSDVAPVIGAAWASYFHREWLGPIPNLAHASVEVLNARTQQLIRSRRAAFLFYTGAYASVVIVRHLHMPVNPLVVFLSIQFLFRVGAPVEPTFLQTLFTRPPDPMECYRAALKASAATFFMSGISGLVLASSFPNPLRGYLTLAGFALLPAIVYRARRRFRELSFLPELTKT